MRNTPIPSDGTILSYFKFGKHFNNHETYYYNASRQVSNTGVTIEFNSEPEQVCYCTESFSNFLRVSKDYKLKPIDFTSTPLDSNGFILDFWMYPLKIDTADEQYLFEISNYVDIILSDRG